VNDASAPTVFRAWIGKEPAPAYLLYGDGAGLAGCLVHAWEKRLRSGGVSFEIHRWTPADLERESPETAWRSPSFFARVRIFVLPDLAEMKKAHREAIREYLEAPEPSATLVLHGTEFRQAQGFSRAPNLLSAAPREQQAVDALADYAIGAAREAGASLSRESAIFLARWVGVSFEPLAAEVGKLLAYARGRKEIIEEDIRALCVSRGEVDPFRLAEALVRKDGPACIELLRRYAMNADAEDYHRLNGAVSWYLRSCVQGRGRGAAVTPGRAAALFRTLSRIDREMKGESRLSPGQIFEIRLLSALS
jgi:DNA polymerase III delta subunit